MRIHVIPLFRWRRCQPEKGWPTFPGANSIEFLDPFMQNLLYLLHLTSHPLFAQRLHTCQTQSPAQHTNNNGTRGTLSNICNGFQAKQDSYVMKSVWRDSLSLLCKSNWLNWSRRHAMTRTGFDLWLEAPPTLVPSAVCCTSAVMHIAFSTHMVIPSISLLCCLSSQCHRDCWRVLSNVHCGCKC